MRGQTIPKATPLSVIPTTNKTWSVAMARIVCATIATRLDATKKKGRGTPLRTQQRFVDAVSAASETAPVMTRPPDCATEKRASVAGVTALENPRDSTIWPRLFVSTVPPPTMMVPVHSIIQAVGVWSIWKRFMSRPTTGTDDDETPPPPSSFALVSSSPGFGSTRCCCDVIGSKEIPFWEYSALSTSSSSSPSVEPLPPSRSVTCSYPPSSLLPPPPAGRPPTVVRVDSCRQSLFCGRKSNEAIGAIQTITRIPAMA
mmetsp:Transcript_2678/g.5991  ORF Transcript_2678/g.5991 Transcript_2678/m.5991 type:complete len:258 (-) Transcript_2678:533-1306(-)